MTDQQLLDAIMDAPIGAHRRSLCAEARRRLPLDELAPLGDAGRDPEVAALRLAVRAGGLQLKGWGRALACEAWAEEVGAVLVTTPRMVVLEVEGASAFGPTRARLGNSAWRQVRESFAGSDVEAALERPADAICMPGGAGAWRKFWLLRDDQRRRASALLDSITT
jgi:hypothetical protein